MASNNSRKPKGCGGQTAEMITYPQVPARAKSAAFGDGRRRGRRNKEERTILRPRMLRLFTRNI
ncbi:MAG: hypothetical protein FWE67_14135 [Planctomycetaceae bacterium]|nr:hypothetical protein [Planctomycetaceae bacterium]